MRSRSREAPHLRLTLSNGRNIKQSTIMIIVWCPWEACKAEVCGAWENTDWADLITENQKVIEVSKVWMREGGEVLAYSSMEKTTLIKWLKVRRRLVWNNAGNVDDSMALLQNKWQTFILFEVWEWWFCFLKLNRTISVEGIVKGMGSPLNQGERCHLERKESPAGPEQWPFMETLSLD